MAVQEALSEGRHSLHWTGHELDAPRLREAHRQLRSPTREAAHREAFRTLLHSGRTAAVGIALDHFTMPDGLSRFGLDGERYTADVLRLARHLLGLPPGDDGAVHASALEVLAEPADAPLIADTLLGTPALTSAVHAAGRMTAAACPLMADHPARRRCGPAKRRPARGRRRGRGAGAGGVIR
ncbi:hypothetical protein F8568_041260 [Actinomadura sp. LD22]|uniref:Uncharacterized protein n=1 Tax=Actinomadura physcomitrii TaxID=2650748 RepID=A0A6I4MTL5_9ACTN|nr:hypothetical protein [Actinomadura physcomitrii]MWA06671.1 hypothetical protein [Actinomadura physcomitrii]